VTIELRKNSRKIKGVELLRQNEHWLKPEGNYGGKKKNQKRGKRTTW